MNASELAQEMLLWEKTQRENDARGRMIEAEVVKIGKTQVVGGCRVSYRAGYTTNDWETPGKTAPAEIIKKHTEEVENIDWNAVRDEVPEIVKKHTTIIEMITWSDVCKEAKIEPVVISKTEPTATIKLEKLP